MAVLFSPEKKNIQRRATKFILHLHFITEIAYKERFISLDLIPVLRIIWSTLVLALFPSCAKALERLEHPLLAFLSLSPRDVELQHIRNVFFFLLEQPESETYSLAEWN